jgi:diguanylate cyclase (GGDEF)-like protein
MLELITYAFDTVLLIAGVGSAVVALKSLGGRLSPGIAVISFGLILLGFAHLSETLLGTLFDFVGEGPPEITHRVLVLGGFSLLVGGIVAVGRELRWERQDLQSTNATLEEAQEDLRITNEELRERNRQLLEARASAATDGLTGIFNHRTFQERVRAEIERADEAATSFGLIMFDLDGFKKANDTLGHQAGDRILQQVAQTAANLAGGDAVYRYGGDEFVILLTSADEEELAAMAESLRAAVESQFGSSSGITISLGWNAYPGLAHNVEETIYGADSAMYRAKASGKNRVARPEPIAERTTTRG